MELVIAVVIITWHLNMYPISKFNKIPNFIEIIIISQEYDENRCLYYVFRQFEYILKLRY